MDETMRQAITCFQAYRQRRQYAAHTIASSTLELRVFFAVCPRPLAQVSFRDIAPFIDWQYQQG